MRLSRRSLAKLATATVIVAAMPEVTVSAKEYGWTEDGEFYPGVGFDTREQAINDARGYLDIGATIQTAEIEFSSLCYPTDCAGCAVDWLLNGGQLGNAMAQWLVDANESGDYQGEFDEACFHVERASLGAAGRLAVSMALRRLEAADLAVVVETYAVLPNDINIPAHLWSPLSEDEALENDLRIALRQWVGTHHLQEELHGLNAYNSQDHTT